MNYPYQAPLNTVPLWTGSPRGDVQQPFTFPLAGSFHPEFTPATNPLDWIDKRYGIPFGRYQGDLIPNQDPHLINGAYLVAAPPHVDSARTAIARDELKHRYPGAGEPPAEAQTDLLVTEWQGGTPAWAAQGGSADGHQEGHSAGTAAVGAASTTTGGSSGPLPLDQILQGLQQVASLAATVASVQAEIRAIRNGTGTTQGQSQTQAQPSQPASVSQSTLTSAISPLASQATAALTELNKQVGTSGGGHWAQQLRSLALEVLKVNSKLAP